jgi:hypothetical protein
MKYMKMLGLFAMAAAALMAFAGAASATELYNGATTQKVGTVLDFSLKSGTSAILKETSPPAGEGGTLDTCTGSTVKGEITSAGSSTTTTTGVNTFKEKEIVEGKEVVTTKTGITWSGCTFPTTTTIPGKLEIHHITGTTNGTLTADAEIGVTINTIFFGTCVYGVTAGTDLGTLTGGNPAHFTANAVAEKLSGSAFACPETSLWTGTYVSTSPAGDFHVEAS